MNDAFQPLATAIVKLVFYAVPVGDAQLPLIVAWLIAGALYFTIRLRFINIRGFWHAVRIVAGKEDRQPTAPGEVSHFQALTTAISGTVGVGNITHVAVAISIGGPGATFRLIVAGFLGMASKFVECTLGVRYRQINADGSVSGGPMFCRDKGLAERGLPRLGKALAWYYAICIMIGCLGIGCMFQANQAYVQFVTATGGTSSPFAGRGWLFGILIAALTAMVIVGGIRSIARVTARLVPFMALLYVATALVVIGANITAVPAVLGAIVTNAVRTDVPLTQGFVAMLEPFIDTVVICTITALVILLTVYDPAMLNDGGLSGVELTSSAFASVLPWFPYVLAVVVIGCTMQLDAVLDFSDSMVFAMALANVTGLYLLAPVVKKDLDRYWRRSARPISRSGLDYGVLCLHNST